MDDDVYAARSTSAEVTLITDRRAAAETRIGSRERWGTTLLGSAVILVGISILADGSLGQVLNGVSGLLWLCAAVMLIIASNDGRRHGRTWLVVVAATAVVAFLVRPGELVPAIGGFLVAGLIAGWSALDRQVFWSKLVPAFYLPMHIGWAVAKAIVRDLSGKESSIRSEPPPTAFIVPVAMLVAAVAGGYIARYVAIRWPPGLERGPIIRNRSE